MLPDQEAGMVMGHVSLVPVWMHRTSRNMGLAVRGDKGEADMLVNASESTSGVINDDMYMTSGNMCMTATTTHLPSAFMKARKTLMGAADITTCPAQSTGAESRSHTHMALQVSGASEEKPPSSPLLLGQSSPTLSRVCFASADDFSKGAPI